ncbi:SDR family oxidoreductase [Nocardioides sp. AE5]|uniref:SDR family NAD(P)-dependent oxidoreductase n=1 Tax=Nocardioides sp. AE5 TaxID=2962573 RepID=UPI002881F12A|nr:SDR family oxidoreductase [Nocardioides sp. AE5]MDT0203846.1 SDR family oxidoreductase [Nocardioides sp. AE5]
MTSRHGFALVTGASRGIGRSTAEVLAATGFDVAFTARTATEGEGTVPPRSLHEPQEAIAVPGSLATTAGLISEYGVRALPVRMDLTDPDSVTAAAAEVLATWGAPAVLVNNALLHLPQTRFLELGAEDLRASLEANLVEQVRLTQALLPAMIAAGGGIIVNLCSGSATTDPRAAPGEGGWSLSYSAAKAGFGRIAGAINAEHRADGIRAFNIEPGFVVTEAGAARGGTDSITATGFAGSPQDASGRVIAWLAIAAPEESNRFLGKVINAPRLAADLAGS